MGLKFKWKKNKTLCWKYSKVIYLFYLGLAIILLVYNFRDYELVCFLDYFKASSETRNKWKMRRE